MKALLKFLQYLITPEYSYDETINICREKRFKEVLKCFVWIAAAVLSAILVGSHC